MTEVTYHAHIQIIFSASLTDILILYIDYFICKLPVKMDNSWYFIKNIFH